MNSKKFLHNTSFSVQLQYIAVTPFKGTLYAEFEVILHAKMLNPIHNGTLFRCLIKSKLEINVYFFIVFFFYFRDLTYFY